MKKVRQTGRTHVAEEWHDFPDGKRRWGEVRTYPVRGDNKQVVAVIVIVIDITKKKELYKQQKNYSKFLSEKLDQTRKKDQKVQLDGGNIDLVVNLSRREAEVLRLLAEGYTNSQISDLLSISQNTVKSHVNNIFNKLGVNDRTQAAVIATRHHLV
jgi:DNA-binding NarL/FixJ family response regulator